MRKIWFVRHGAPKFPGRVGMCVGTTDVPLSTLGMLQACVAGAYLRAQGVQTVYSSPLTRARDTAGMISPEPVVTDELREMYAGDWEGLTFRQIREKWPELYRQRGENRNLPIPGEESMSSGRKRFSDAVEQILKATVGDVVIVSHITVMQTFLCGFLKIPVSECRNISIPYGSCTVLELGAEAAVTQIGVRPSIPLSEELCARLMASAGVREQTVLHCRKVAEKAAEIADRLIRAGYDLNREQIIYAALLHDIARCEPGHARIGGEWLAQLGYEDVGKLVLSHHDILPPEISEAAVLSLADRSISGTEEVSLEERFSRSLEKCRDEEAKLAHRARYENAMALQRLVDSACQQS